ncbi:hypothetical protein BV20DRAFT_1058172 [Pilatotrama ljubarskyi]|nr:hypothetical protein BV20DRAFT_1058172 [Pilatotrama ljubarskyi]
MPWTACEERERRACHPKLTLAEKRTTKKARLQEALAHAREAMWNQVLNMKEEFGSHSVDYCYQLIMQALHASRSSRKIAFWNGFVSVEMKKRNKDQECRTREKVSSNIIKDLSKHWQNMSHEERWAAGQDAAAKLTERRQNHAEGIQNVPLFAFNDVWANVASVHHKLENLHGCMGTEFLHVGVRSQTDHFNLPYIFYTNERIVQFVGLLTNISMQDFALRLEGFCVSGVDSLKKSSSDDLVELKCQVSSLILEKIQCMNMCERLEDVLRELHRAHHRAEGGEKAAPPVITITVYQPPTNGDPTSTTPEDEPLTENPPPAPGDCSSAAHDLTSAVTLPMGVTVNESTAGQAAVVTTNNSTAGQTTTAVVASHRQKHPADVFLHTVTTPDSNGIVVSKRAQKEWSDTGKMREKKADKKKGKNGSAPAAAVVPSAATATPAAPVTATPAAPATPLPVTAEAAGPSASAATTTTTIAPDTTAITSGTLAASTGASGATAS